MPTWTGTASAVSTRLRAALAGDAAALRWLLVIVAAAGLWLFAWRLIVTAPPPSHNILMYRIDANEIVAYPRSDAAMDYLNAMAILSGDGWVNWRVTNRWSAYRPGWGAFLGGLALVTGADPAAMQGILNVLLAATAPAFLLLLLHLYPGGRDWVLALAVAIVWTAKPFFDWRLHQTMMTEGPTMLLSLLFCLLALRFCGRRGEWTWRQGAVLGLLAGALFLVREQSRYGVLLVVALLAVVAIGALRRRLPFFVALALGALVVTGPVFLKTSIHLRLPYAGTSFTALYNVLEYTPVGRYAGGTGFPDGVPLAEREAMRLYQQRLRHGLAGVLSKPGELLHEGFRQFSRAIHMSVAQLLRLQLPPPRSEKPAAGRLAVLWGLAALGVFFAWRRAGPVTLAPLLFALGYFAPSMAFWFYSNRLGLPISWVGPVYAAGALLPVLRPGGRHAWRQEAVATADDAPRGAGWPGWRLFALAAGWLAVATAVLLWLDLRPLPAVDVERLFAAGRSRRALAEAGVAADARLVAEADRLLNGDVASDRLLAGIAVLPMSLAPGDEPVLQPFSKERLRPGSRGFDLFYLVSPWKRGGALGMFRVRLGLGAAAAVRHGDEVLVVRQAGAPQTVGKNLVVRLEGAAVLPTRWAE